LQQVKHHNKGSHAKCAVIALAYLAMPVSVHTQAPAQPTGETLTWGRGVYTPWPTISARLRKLDLRYREWRIGRTTDLLRVGRGEAALRPVATEYFRRR
jgi:hypothetical protein